MSPDAVEAGPTRGFRDRWRRRRGPAFPRLFFSFRADPRCRGREGDETGRVSHLGGPGSGSAPCGHDGRA